MSDAWTDGLKMQRSFEHDLMMAEFDVVANDLLSKYGPEGAFEINRILSKLIDEDVQRGMSFDCID